MITNWFATIEDVHKGGVHRSLLFFFRLVAKHGCTPSSILNPSHDFWALQKMYFPSLWSNIKLESCGLWPHFLFRYQDVKSYRSDYLYETYPMYCFCFVQEKMNMTVHREMARKLCEEVLDLLKHTKHVQNTDLGWGLPKHTRHIQNTDPGWDLPKYTRHVHNTDPGWDLLKRTRHVHNTDPGWDLPKHNRLDTLSQCIVELYIKRKTINFYCIFTLQLWTLMLFSFSRWHCWCGLHWPP